MQHLVALLFAASPEQECYGVTAELFVLEIKMLLATRSIQWPVKFFNCQRWQLFHFWAIPCTL
jgi:hypothetical protein